MTKDELVELVQHANALWSRTPSLADVKAQNRAWYALLQDLDFGACKDAIERLSFSRQFIPRPAEVRIAARGIQWPTPLQAWVAYQNMRAAVANGTSTPDFDPRLIPWFKTIGALGLHTNGDRDLFISEYQKYIDAESMK